MALDHRLGSGDDASRRAALRALLAELPPEGIEPDWEYVTAEMHDARGAGDAGAPE